MTKLAKSIRYSMFFGALTVLALFDIFFDFKHGIPLRHILFEILVFLMGLIGLNYFAIMVTKRYKSQHETLETLKSDINKKDQELVSLSKKVKSYKDEFRAEVENTFKEWHLTKTEVEIAGLLLKGLSLKEIADLRGSNERTVRAQCSSIYKKSKLQSRSQLSSYFLDDLI